MNKGDTVTLKGSLMFRKQPLGSRDEWFMSIELGVRGTFVAYRNSRSGRMAEIEYAPGVYAIVPADAVEVVTDNNVGESEQASQSQVPEGWQLVPKEPTSAMCVAAQGKLREWPRFPFRIVPTYKAMLAAAPLSII